MQNVKNYVASTCISGHINLGMSCSLRQWSAASQPMVSSVAPPLLAEVHGTAQGNPGRSRGAGPGRFERIQGVTNGKAKSAKFPPPALLFASTTLQNGSLQILVAPPKKASRTEEATHLLAAPMARTVCAATGVNPLLRPSFHQ